MSTPFQPFHTTPVADLDTVYTINLKGTFLCMQQQISMMLEQDRKGEVGKRGVIVNMSSMSAVDGVAFAARYAATKKAVTVPPLSRHPLQSLT